MVVVMIKNMKKHFENHRTPLEREVTIRMKHISKYSNNKKKSLNCF